MSRKSRPCRSRRGVRPHGSRSADSAWRFASRLPWTAAGRATDSSASKRREATRCDAGLGSACAVFAVPVFLITAVVASQLQAGGLLGRVLDPHGAAVVNARLRLFDRDGGTVRNARSRMDGTYAFPNLLPGEYLLEGAKPAASLAGSRALKVGGQTRLDLDLAVSASTVEIVVTASSTPAAQAEIAKALDAGHDEEIALRDEYSLAEALRSTPGVRVQQLRGPGSLATIQTRGLRKSDTALYQDLLLFDTDRVEFMRGSGSSLYGSRALGGAIRAGVRILGSVPQPLVEIA